MYVRSTLNRVVLSLAFFTFCTTAWGEGDNFRRIEEDEFPENAVLIDFDVDPDGNQILEGRDLTRVYVDRGCTLETEFEDSVIQACNYRVHPGRRFCAGNRKPLYQGTITVRFCQPGKEDAPAGVHYVGFWIAYIEPRGSFLVALDKDGKPLGHKIHTRKRGHDYLGVYSKQPIAAVEIRLDPKIDQDHAIDNLRFDPPQPLTKMPLP